MRGREFIAVWFSIVVLGTVLTVETLEILNIQSGQIEQSIKPTEASNHFSVQCACAIGVAPTDYGDQYRHYYIDINRLADKKNKLTIQFSLRIVNQEDNGYYFLIEKYSAPPPGWTIPTCHIGYIAVNETKTFVYSDLERTRPMCALTECVDLVVKAFRDSSCSNLYSQDNLQVTFHFLDRRARPHYVSTPS